MDSRTIYANLKTHKSTKKCFEGIYSFDMLPDINQLRSRNKNKKEIYLVVNTDPVNKPGEHWFTLCIQNQRNKPNEYFDSYGKYPPTKIIEYLEHFFVFSKVPLQNEMTTTCGQWCMYYILFKSHGGSFYNFVHHFMNKIKPSKRDESVNDYIKLEFSEKNLPVQDISFIIQQIATPKNR